MSAKILTVDDSRAVRIIVKKAFKAYDVEVAEATNGVEGLSAASSEKPDLIILDVTMPVMDGVEMLTKLKSDPLLKNIPVIMLTAEAGRENILKIAKIGIRDYIVKPFKDEMLLDKVGRVIELTTKDTGSTVKKGIDDPFEILVIEDKPAIIAQIEKGLKPENWHIHGVSTSSEAIDFCNKQVPDIAIMSLSLPDDGAVNIFRYMRSNNNLKYVPVFGLSVKTATEEQDKARGAGISQIVHKPINFGDLEDRIVKALKLDTSGRYFKFSDDALIVSFPEELKESSIKEIDNYIKPKISEAVDNGFYKVIYDLTAMESIDMEVVSLLADAMKICKDMTLQFALAAGDGVIAECSGYDESNEWSFYPTVDEAKEALS